MDPFSDVIGLLRPHAVLSKPITGRGRWGVRYDAYEQPGFAIVPAGQCWLALDGDEPVQLERGDFVLLPASPAFALSSHPGVACALVEPRTPVRHGDPDGEPDVQMLGGAFRIEPVNAAPLTGLLPRMIHVRATESDTSRLARFVHLLTRGMRRRPARSRDDPRTVASKSCWSNACAGRSRSRSPAGWPARRTADPALAGALRRCTRSPRRMDGRRPRDWPAMSASAFAARFARQPRLRPDGISRALAHGARPGRAQSRQHAARPSRRRHRLRIRQRLQHRLSPPRRCLARCFRAGVVPVDQLPSASKNG